MKKILLTAIAAAAFILPAAVQAEQNYVEPDQSFDIFQIGMLKSAPSTQDTAPVYGLRFGLPVCGGKAAVHGIDFAIVGSQTDNIIGFQYATFFTIAAGESYGLKISCVNASEKLRGAEIGAANISKDSVLQVGAFNYAETGFQLGVINVMKKGFLPVMILFNFSI